MTATTIKIDSALRDHLNAAARERGVPVGSFVEELFEAWLREQRFARLRDEMARTPDAASDPESRAWEAVAGDGLDDAGLDDAGLDHAGLDTARLNPAPSPRTR
ncbi:hypothetical protein CLV28_2996 [Sediminihabitans luteus]|uniref:Uncharacterized protein n=1 Tax=Sediminihabitans luteus TaxID=1138585 RepID=A0A2M9CC42_9CELL|nr:hypothetical protein [Sediminihabitans luteus]PJJ68580.1 hypothetical protein CLV28_2996 [Sediminihabitans luteus]GII99918.1 hypothetical protein Slu03_22960 [Sediminihabitans luteus]